MKKFIKKMYEESFNDFVDWFDKYYREVIFVWIVLSVFSKITIFIILVIIIAKS